MVNQGVITDQLGKPVEKNSSKYWVKDNQSDQKTGFSDQKTKTHRETSREKSRNVENAEKVDRDSHRHSQPNQ